MKEAIGRAISEAGIIPAVKDADALGRCLSLEQEVVFVLFGDICTIGETIETLHRAGKFAIVHADLIGGLRAKGVAADFPRARGADGVTSTRPQVVKRGGELGMFTVLRFFVFDSLSLRSVEKTAAAVGPDMAEILPGIMPRIVRRLSQHLPMPLLCGGLIEEKADVLEALGAGAVAISSTREEVWQL